MLLAYIDSLLFLDGTLYGPLHSQSAVDAYHKMVADAQTQVSSISAIIFGLTEHSVVFYIDGHRQNGAYYPLN